MKPLYRTAFQLERVGEPLNAIHEIAQVCLDWVFRHKGKPREGIVRPESLGKHAQDFPVAVIGNRRKLETRYWKGADERLWALRLTHPDDEDPEIEWCVELTLECSSQEAKFTCAQFIRRLDLKAGTLLRPATQPGVVAQLIERYGARVGELFSLDGKPQILDENPFRSKVLLDLLTFPQRYSFVILITPGRDGRPLVDASLWARKLCPLAFVFVAENDAATRAFESALGSKRLACWGGALRIYRPGFTLTDDAFRHRYLLPAELESIVKRGQEMTLLNDVMTGLTQEASQQGQTEFLFWPAWVDRVGQLRIADLQRTSQDDAALSRLFAEENETLRGNLGEMEHNLGRLQDEVNILKGWKQAAQRAHRDIRDGAKPAHALRDLTEVNSVADAIAVAKDELSGELEFHLNSKSDPLTPFQSPTDVLYAFRWLAGPFRRAKSGRLAIADLEAHFAEYLPTWVYAPNQSEITMGQNPEWYRIDYKLPKGQPPMMRMHLACGNDRKPEKCIRIGFVWDAQREIVAVGFIGQHQRSAKS